MSAEKVVFVIPPFFRLLASQNRRMQPAIHTLAEVAAKEGFDTTVYNGDHDPEAGDSYADWYSIAHNHHAYRKAVAEGHPAFDEMAREVAEMNPSAVVVSAGDVILPTVDLGSVDCAHMATKYLREKLPGLYAAAYGPQVTFNATSVLQWADCAIQYEGERSIASILKEKPKGVAIDGGNLSDKELDELPFNNPGRLYRPVGPHDLDYIVRGRGCPYSCNFCFAPMLSKKVRRFSIKRFLDEMEYRHTQFGVKWFYIADMIFELKKRDAIELCEGMIRREFPQRGIKWCCESRIDTIDREKAEMMLKAGCSQVKLGVEAGTDEQLAAMDKGITTKQVQATFAMLREVGIKISTYVLLGQVGATRATYEQGYEFLRDLKADYYVVNVAVPYKGTILYDQVQEALKKRSLLSVGSYERNFTHLSGSLIDFWGLTPELIEKYMQLSGTTVKGKEDGALRKFERRLLEAI
jgi:radical SAM superfamily enzyme YgiQ (UPF0313 family)